MSSVAAMASRRKSNDRPRSPTHEACSDTTPSSITWRSFEQAHRTETAGRPRRRGTRCVRSGDRRDTSTPTVAKSARVAINRSSGRLRHRRVHREQLHVDPLVVSCFGRVSVVRGRANASGSSRFGNMSLGRRTRLVSNDQTCKAAARVRFAGTTMKTAIVRSSEVDQRTTAKDGTGEQSRYYCEKDQSLCHEPPGLAQRARCSFESRTTVALTCSALTTNAASPSPRRVEAPSPRQRAPRIARSPRGPTKNAAKRGRTGTYSRDCSDRRGESDRPRGITVC